ncbi:hypothetical protein TUMEXPCC7403_17205 [Tumidithrix helvetica PCC 7403]|uniref:hypothetical protein n=1 Tax=Tumidithrix helvetica TaxID=3457545 RepID=UPI003CB09D21
MQKLVLSCFVTMFSIAIASTTSVMSANAQTAVEYIDSSSPQVVENISGNIVTFKNVSGESHNYYVPTWMIEKYDLKVSSSTYLYNRNIVQGIYHSRYIDEVSPGLLEMDAFTLHETLRNCRRFDNPESEGLGSGKRVWYKTEGCPSTIPIVGAMGVSQPKTVAFVETSSTTTPINSTTSTDSTTPTNYTNPTPEVAPVRGLW